MTGSLKSYLAEFFGTFALVLAGAGAVCVDVLSGGRLGAAGIALSQGLAAVAAVYAFGPVSGGHFNPAVSAAMLLARRLSAVKAVFYLFSQLLGSAAAALLLAAVFHAHPELSQAAPFLGACDLAHVGFNAATLLEAMAAFFLVSAMYATAVDRRSAPGSFALAVGASYAAGTLLLGPLTGAALNPARAFGPAVATGHWAHWYVYWVGPLAGAVAASQAQEHLFLEENKVA